MVQIKVTEHANVAPFLFSCTITCGPAAAGTKVYHWSFNLFKSNVVSQLHLYEWDLFLMESALSKRSPMRRRVSCLTCTTSHETRVDVQRFWICDCIIKKIVFFFFNTIILFALIIWFWINHCKWCKESKLNIPRHTELKEIKHTQKKSFYSLILDVVLSYRYVILEKHHQLNRSWIYC